MTDDAALARELADSTWTVSVAGYGGRLEAGAMTLDST